MQIKSLCRSYLNIWQDMQTESQLASKENVPSRNASLCTLYSRVQIKNL